MNHESSTPRMCAVSFKKDENQRQKKSEETKEKKPNRVMSLKNLSKTKENTIAFEQSKRKKSEPKPHFQENPSPQNNHKITDFFQKNLNIKQTAKPSKVSSSSIRNYENSNNNSIRNTYSTSSFGVKREINLENLKLKEEIRKLNKIMVDKDTLISNNEKRLENIRESNEMHMETLKRASDYEKNLEVKSKDTIRNFLLEKEAIERRERKKIFFEQSLKIGKEITLKEDGKEKKEWFDGHDLMKLKQEAEKIKQEKLELQKLKKENNPTKSQENDSVSFEPAAMTVKRYSLSLIDPKQSLNFQLHFLTKEENRIIDEIKKLENQKNSIRILSQNVVDEENCAFIKEWPLLQEKYQPLRFIGKSRLSEVYKAFDVKKLHDIVIKLRFYEEDPTIMTSKIQTFQNSFIKPNLSHPNIAKLFDCFQYSPNSIVFIIEYCDGENLSNILKNPNFSISEKEARNFIKQIMHGLLYLHDHRIIHGNIKPENLIFHNGDIKIADYWFFKENEEIDDFLYYEENKYLPPEFSIKPKEYDFSYDIWSVGIILYEMLFGEKPETGNLKFPLKPCISTECKDFITRCLTVEWKKRWSVKQAMEGIYLSKI